MKSTVNVTLKLFLVVCLFSSMIFAEGDMGNGGFADGDMGNGGRTCTENCAAPAPSDPTIVNNEDQTASEDGILLSIQNFLASLFG